MQPVPTSPGAAAAWQQEAEGIGVQTPPPPTPKHLPLLAAAVRPPTDSCRCGEQTEHDSLHPPLPFSPKQNTHPKTGGNQAGKTRRSFDNYFKPPLSQEGAGLTPTTSPPAIPELPRAPHPDPVPAAGGLGVLGLLSPRFVPCTSQLAFQRRASARFLSAEPTRLEMHDDLSRLIGNTAWVLQSQE